MESEIDSITWIGRLVRIGGIMKKIFVSIALVFLIVVASASFASAATVDVQVPFNGTIQGIESQTVNFPTMYVEGNGSGNSILLGKFSFHYTGVVNLITSAGTGLSAHFVAANGDTIDAEGYGQGNPTGTISYVKEWYTITGGTGRFAGATGKFILNRQVNKVTGAISGKFDGAIVLPEGR
jgi:hypothetical protein